MSLMTAMRHSCAKDYLSVLEKPYALGGLTAEEIDAMGHILYYF